MDLINKKEGDQLVSPVLPEHVKNYLIDIDGTITDDVPPPANAFKRVQAMIRHSIEQQRT